MVHPDHLLEQLTQRQLSEWIARNNISPIGDTRDDVRMAIMTSHLRSAWVESDVEPDQFLPQFPIYTQAEAEPETDAQRKLRQHREASQFR